MAVLDEPVGDTQETKSDNEWKYPDRVFLNMPEEDEGDAGGDYPGDKFFKGFFATKI